MCGILGVVGLASGIQDALKIMRHRGPDNNALVFLNNNENIFGHLRLSIIDLDVRSSQPMYNDSRNLVIVFNGEIYNYQSLRDLLLQKGHTFKTNSDTEVLLYAWQQWGTDCLQMIKGMFAFAIYDASLNKIFLARDRMGEKPLYFSHNKVGFIFASELKAVLTITDSFQGINMNAFDHLLSYGYVPGFTSIFTDIEKLPPAHALSYDINTSEITKWQYWKAPVLDITETTDEGALLTELEEVLSESVKHQLVADVPLGLLLSGGLDSSILTALAARSRNDIKTYTVSFPQNDGFDESAFAEKIAHHFGTTHTTLHAGEVDINELYLLARQFDEPMTDPSLVPTYLLCKKIREHCKVAMGGDGADELFGGYHRYQDDIRLASKSKYIPQSLRKTLASIATSVLPIGYPGRYTLQTLSTDFSKEIPWQASLFDSVYRKKLLRRGQLPLTAENYFQLTMQPGHDVADRAIRNDLQRYLPEDILVKSDRASMLASLELRAPFLDVGVVEFALGKVPSSLKVNGNERKILLKRLARKLLPTDYDFNRKQGFVPPLENWFRKKEWKEFILDHLLYSSDTWFDPAMVESLWKGQEKGYFNKRRIFTLLMIELWRKEYKLHLPYENNVYN